MASSAVKKSKGRIYEILEHETPQRAEDIRVVFTPAELIVATHRFCREQAANAVERSTDETSLLHDE